MGNTQYKEHIYSSGNVYRGSWSGGKRSGEGTYTWADGSSYRGHWKNNLQDGFGVMSFPNGNVYEGEFKGNNPSGDGVLRTKNNESIAGTWQFTGRSFPTGSQNYPVGTFLLNVSVTNNLTGESVQYQGQASLHLQTGLLVLPGMPAPEISAYSDGDYMPVAPFVVADNDSFGELAQAVTVPDNEQRLIDAEERAEFPMVVLDNGTPAVAYGVQDSALNVRPAANPNPVPYNPIDPRNYF